MRRRNWILAGLGAIILLVIAYSWVDGGNESMRDMSEPVPLPELPA